MEFDEHEDREDEMEEAEDIPPLQSHPGYAAAGGDAAATSSASRKPTGGGHFRYRECLKNHAVGIGGNAVDGCGEFMPAGEEGTLDALRCAACGCHRNFHRRESEPEVGVGGSLVFHHFSPYYRAAQPPSGYLHVTPATLHRPLALPAVSGGGHSREELEDVSNPSSSGGGGGSRLMKMKRSRTKFTAEQKEKMLGFAERVGWRLQRHDEAEVEQFCAETGVKRHVLKVWMHNNKNTFGKKTTT